MIRAAYHGLIAATGKGVSWLLLFSLGKYPVHSLRLPLYGAGALISSVISQLSLSKNLKPWLVVAMSSTNGFYGL